MGWDEHLLHLPQDTSGASVALLDPRKRSFGGAIDPVTRQSRVARPLSISRRIFVFSPFLPPVLELEVS